MTPILLTLALAVSPCSQIGLGSNGQVAGEPGAAACSDPFVRPDLGAQGLALAIAAAARDAQQPCHEVKAGPCLKTAPTAVDHFATWAIVADNVCAFYDITSTLAGTVTGELVELNPLLAPFQKNVGLMTTTRAAMQVVKWLVFREMKSRGPKWAMWTGITASATAGLGCGAAIHNTREMQQR